MVYKKEYHKKYYQKHKKERREYYKRWKEKHYPKYYSKNKDKLCKQSKKYYEDFREKVLKRQAIYKKRQRENPKFMFCQYKIEAKKRNHKWDLTFQQFKSFWQKPCYYCGSKMETIGIDRVDNSKGYLIDNVVSCCEKCNRAKYVWKKDDFLNHCKKVVQFQKKNFIN